MGKGPNPGTWAAAAVLLLAAVLRLWGIRFGLPVALLHLDEPPIVLRAGEILRTGDWNPHWFHYPGFFIYMQVLLQAAARIAGGGDPFLLGRLSSAGAGVLTVLLTYVWGTRIFSRGAGLMGALFLAVSFLHARESHFATVDATATLWVTGTLLLTSLGLARGREGRRRLLAAALLGGLAAGTKYNAGLVLAAPLVALFLDGGGGRRVFWAAAIVGLGAAAFLATTPYALADSSTFLKDLRFEAHHYRGGHFGFESDLNALYYFRYLLAPGLGEGILALSLLGLVVWGGKRTRAAAPAMLFLLLYYGMISLVRVNFVRNLVPVLPVLCLLSGVGLEGVVHRLPLREKARSVVLAVALAALVALPVQRTVTYDRAIAHSTRLEAGRWVRENIPAGSRIVTEIYGPEPTPRDCSVSVVLHLTDRPVDWYEEEGIEFLVASSGAYEMAYSNRDRYPDVVRRYEDLFRRFPVIAEFRGERVDPLYSSICPTIKILAGPRRSPASLTPRNSF